MSLPRIREFPPHHQVDRLKEAFPKPVLDYHARKLHLSDEAVQSRLTAFSQFLVLCLQTRTEQVAPEEADELWHDFLMFTREYEKFCSHNLGGRMHHLPIIASPPSGYFESREQAIRIFGPLPESAWPLDDRVEWSVGLFEPYAGQIV